MLVTDFKLGTASEFDWTDSLGKKVTVFWKVKMESISAKGKSIPMGSIQVSSDKDGKVGVPFGAYVALIKNGITVNGKKLEGKLSTVNCSIDSDLSKDVEIGDLKVRFGQVWANKTEAAEGGKGTNVWCLESLDALDGVTKAKELFLIEAELADRKAKFVEKGKKEKGTEEYDEAAFKKTWALLLKVEAKCIEVNNRLGVVQEDLTVDLPF